MNRRQFAQRIAVSLVASQSARTAAAQSAPATPTLYYVDGYHGGSRGHMPAGSWRDILNAMRAMPTWKISLDIEASTWDDFRREDPEAYRELARFLEDRTTAARVEICNGTFSQPFGWAHTGESNIRQIQRGLEIIRAHFPKTLVETYAVQEPCWSSCLPQILRSLGFTAAVLKNPGTAWGGYSAGFDAETVDWVGPDGTSIPAVPRYACEDLVRTWETESVTGSPAFARKCIEHGIAHPAGNCFQDLGWAARPKVTAPHIQYTTWREYMQTIAAKPQKQWRFTPEDILTTLPWGEKTLQTIAQQVRSAENRLLAAEKLASMAAALAGVEYPVERFRRAWDQLLWAQHHDAWITATTRNGRQAWAFQVAAETLEAEETGAAILAESAEALSRGEPQAPAAPLGPQWVRVFNTSAAPRNTVAEVSWAADTGTHHPRMFDAAGREIPCQLVEIRRFTPRGAAQSRGGAANTVAGIPNYAPGESLNAATVVFQADTPALGYATYRIEPQYGDAAPTAFEGAASRRGPDGKLILETDLYRIALDPEHGGVLTSLVAKTSGHEFVDASAERRFNEYRGYFITEKQWASSADSRANVAIVENGPVRVRVQVSGRILGRRYQTTITAAQGSRRIDFTARFTYDQDTWIGDPWDIAPENRREERRRSPHDGRFKLQAFFPAPFAKRSIFKNAAYDVCRSRNETTWFQGWDEIKHCIVVNWVDVYDEELKRGLAVLSDHTTGYSHGPDHPLALVMGWGWEGGYWWGKCPLRGTQQVSYALVPHEGAWDEGQVSRESEAWNEPVQAQILDGALGATPAARSLVAVSGQGVEIPTVQLDGKLLRIRLYNAEGDDSERTVSLNLPATRVDLVELDGRAIRQLELRSGQVKLSLPRHGIRTLQCQLA